VCWSAIIVVRFGFFRDLNFVATSGVGCVVCCCCVINYMIITKYGSPFS
jgi:hypothetical protein